MAVLVVLVAVRQVLPVDQSPVRTQPEVTVVPQVLVERVQPVLVMMELRVDHYLGATVVTVVQPMEPMALERPVVAVAVVTVEHRT